MDVELSEAQKRLQAEARAFLDRECPTDLVRSVEKERRGCPPELWARACERGWLGVALPKEHGGSGGDYLDMAVLLEEMGRALFPGPLAATLVYGALPILAFGTEGQQRRYLADIARGRVVFTGAMAEPWVAPDSSPFSTLARRTDEGYVLRGRKLFVPHSTSADFFLVSARAQNSGRSLLSIVPKEAHGLTVSLLEGLASEYDGEVSLDGVLVPGEDVLGNQESGPRIMKQVDRWSAVALCAQMLGACQKLLEMTVEYAKQRVQFGRPIGSFQAIQHHCANMAIDVDSMRLMTYHAAWKLARGSDAEPESSMAKLWCSEAADRVAALAHQVHAAIAFTEEHPLPLFSRRLKVWSLACGSAAEREETIAGNLGLQPS
jgi:alkylation response protein AidB-like acyl-CoA dehydrogenase